MSEPRYIPWCLNDARAWPWGIKDTHTGVNVLSHFLPEPTGAIFCHTQAAAEGLIARGRMWEFDPQMGRLVRCGEHHPREAADE